MPVKTKRWNDPMGSDDGFRVLICRFRPRGVRRTQATWDEWCKDLGPSPALLTAFRTEGRSKIGWSEYRRRYLAEMQDRGPLVRALADRIRRGGTVTLLCASSCTDERRCHRSLLRELIERELRRARD